MAVRKPLVGEGADLAAQDERAGWPVAAEDLAGAPLVGVILIRVDERDRQRLDPLRRQGGHQAGNLVLDQRLEDAPGGIQTLGGLPAPLAWDHRLEGRLPATKGAPSSVAELQEIAKSRRGQQARAGPLALEQRIRRHGRPVGNLGDLVRRSPALSEGGLDAGRDVVGCGGGLVERETAVRLVADDDIGEGPTDVNADVVPVMSHAYLPEPAGSYAVLRSLASRKTPVEVTGNHRFRRLHRFNRERLWDGSFAGFTPLSNSRFSKP